MAAATVMTAAIGATLGRGQTANADVSGGAVTAGEYLSGPERRAGGRPDPPPAPAGPPGRGRGWKSRARRDEKIAALIVGPLVALMVAAGVATGDDDVSGPKAEATATPETLAVREGEILFQDDFSDSTSGWATGVSEEGEVGYVEGAYRIFAKAGR